MAIKTKNILVTGSAGYLGSPFCFDLLKMGHKVIGIDNYINSDKTNTNLLKEHFVNNFTFYKLNLAEDKNELDKIFSKHSPDIVVHFAALKSIIDSEKYPDLYWRNNIQSTKNILILMSKYDCFKIIFSSSAAVYGNQDICPIKENAILNPTSVYAKTKIECEDLIKNACLNLGIDGISLRYFNPIGFHSSKLFKEELNNNNRSILNEIIKSSIDENYVLKIFGEDYSTEDGTCERDFIHIEDLLDAHEKSIGYIKKFSGYDVFNVGTGRSVSIKNLIDSFTKYNQINLKYEFSKKRCGDVESSYADVSKINNKLQWESKKTLEDMVKDSWKAYIA